MDTSLNIVDLIENNPITRLSSTYQSKLLTKIKDGFSELEQQMFVSSFYCYLNYHKTNDFVIDLDNVWQWLGFSQKVNAKKVLEKNFVIDMDYKCLLCKLTKQKSDGRGGHNKDTFMLDLDYKQSLLPDDKQTTAGKGGHNKETFLYNYKRVFWRVLYGIIVKVLITLENNRYYRMELFCMISAICRDCSINKSLTSWFCLRSSITSAASKLGGNCCGTDCGAIIGVTITLHIFL